MPISQWKTTAWKQVLGIFTMLASPSVVHAAPGHTVAAAPTHIEQFQSLGFVVFGAFGNPGESPCTAGDRIFISTSHPRYQDLLSTAITAVASGMKLQAYVHSCAMVGWYGFTMNELGPSGSLILLK